MYLKKLKKDDAARITAWWHWLDDNRGDRAQLRRAQSPNDVLLTAAFAHFLQKMPKTWTSDNKIPITDMAMMAAVLARVKKIPENNYSFAKTLALPKESGSKSAMSELRFQQLQKSQTEDEFFMRLCRAVALMGGKVNIVSLADDILHWLSEHRYGPASKPQDRLAVCWASDYYAAFKE